MGATKQFRSSTRRISRFSEEVNSLRRVLGKTFRRCPRDRLSKRLLPRYSVIRTRVTRGVVSEVLVQEGNTLRTTWMTPANTGSVATLSNFLKPPPNVGKV